MRNAFSVLLVGGVLILGLVATDAAAGPSEHLNWGAQLHSGAFSCPSGTPVINVVQKVVNSVDSGTAGNWWAFEDYVRQIKVVQVGTNAFCATVSYRGSFSSIVGDSPGWAYTGGSIGEGVVGTFEGGYVGTFTGTLRAVPGRRAKGSIGTDDYNCDPLGNCSGSFFWADLYFTGIGGFDQPWWGWVYHAGNNGSWTNAVTGNSGDITGN
jgi:hypothetical protein